MRRREFISLVGGAVTTHQVHNDGDNRDRMATRQERIDAFTHQRVPPADQPLELLCEDHVGTALENCVSRRRELALVETRFECWVNATESQASHAALTIRVASR